MELKERFVPGYELLPDSTLTNMDKREFAGLLPPRESKSPSDQLSQPQ